MSVSPPPAALVERVLAARVSHTLAAFGGSATDAAGSALSGRADPLSARVRTKQQQPAVARHRPAAPPASSSAAAGAAAASIAAPVPPASHAPPSSVSIPLVRSSWLPGADGESSASGSAAGGGGAGSFLSLLLHPGTHPALASIARGSTHRALESAQLSLASAVYAPLMRDHPSAAPWLSISRGVDSLTPRELRAFRSHIFLSAEVQLLLRLLWELALPKRKSDELLSFSGYKSLYLRINKRFMGPLYKPREVARLCESAWMRDWSGADKENSSKTKSSDSAGNPASTATTAAAAAAAVPSREFSVVQGLPIQYFLQSLFDLVDQFVCETGTVDVDTTQGAPASGSDGAEPTEPAAAAAVQSTQIHRGPAVLSVPLGHNSVSIPLPATERYVRVLEKALREITCREPAVTELPTTASGEQAQDLPPLYHFALRELPKVSMSDFNAASTSTSASASASSEDEDHCTPLELRAYTLSAVYALLQHPSSEFQQALHRPPRVPAPLAEQAATGTAATAATATPAPAVHQPLPSAGASGDLRKQASVAPVPVQVQHEKAATPARGVATKGATATVGSSLGATAEGRPVDESNSAAASTAASVPAMGAVSSSSRAASQEKAVASTAASSASAPRPSPQPQSAAIGGPAVVDGAPKTKLQLRSSVAPLKLLVNNASAPDDAEDRSYLPSDSPVAAWGGRDDDELDAESLAAAKRNSSSSASLLAAGAPESSTATAASSAPTASAASSKPPKRPAVASSSQRAAAGAGSKSKDASRSGSTDHTPLSSPALTMRQLKQPGAPPVSPAAPRSPAAPKSPATTARGRLQPQQQQQPASVTSNAKISPATLSPATATSSVVSAVSSSSAAASVDTDARVSVAAESKPAAGSSSPPKGSVQASTPAQVAAATAASIQPTAGGTASVQSSTPPRPSMHVRHASLTASLAPKPRLRTLVSMALAASRAAGAAADGAGPAAATGSSIANAAAPSNSAAAGSKAKLGAADSKFATASRDLSTPPPPKQVDHTNSLLASLRALVNMGAKSISAHLDALKRREETAAQAANALVATAIPSAAVNLGPAAAATPAVPVAAASSSSKSGSKVVSAAASPAGSKRGSVAGTPSGASPLLKPAAPSASSSTASLDLAAPVVSDGVAATATAAAAASSGDGLHVMEGTSNNEELTDLAAGAAAPATVAPGPAAEPDADLIIAQAKSNAAQASLDASDLALRDASESLSITADVDALLGLVSSAHEARRGGEKTNIELLIDQATALHKASNMEIERLPQFIVDAAAQVDETMAARKARVALQAQQMKAEAAAAAASNSGSSSPRKLGAPGGGRPRAASVIDAKSSARGAGALAHSNSSRSNLLKSKAASGATSASASGETTPTAGTTSPKRGPIGGGSKKGGAAPGKGGKKGATTTASAATAPSTPLPAVPVASVDSAASAPADQVAASTVKPSTDAAAAPADAAATGPVADDGGDDDSRSSTPKPDTLIAAFHVAVDGGVKFKSPEAIERQRIEDERANAAVAAGQTAEQLQRAALEAEMRGDTQEEADADAAADADEISPVSEGDENEALSGADSSPSSRLASPSHATAAAAARQSLVDASLSRNTWHHNQVLLGRSTRDEAREEARMEAALAAQALRIKTQQQRLSERRGRESGAQKRAARVSVSQQDGELLRQQLAEEKAARAEELAAEIAAKRAAIKAPRILVSAGAIGALVANHPSDPFLPSTEADDLVPPAELARKISAPGASKLAIHSAGGAHKRYTSAFENLLSVVDDDAAAAAALAAARAHTESKMRAVATMLPTRASPRIGSGGSKPAQVRDEDDLFGHLETIVEPIVTSSAAPGTPPLSPRSQALEDAQNQRRVELTAEEEAAMRDDDDGEDANGEETQRQSQTQEMPPLSQPEVRQVQHSAELSTQKIAPQSRVKKQQQIQQQQQQQPLLRKPSLAQATTKEGAATASQSGSAAPSRLQQNDSSTSLKNADNIANDRIDERNDSAALLPQSSAVDAATLVPVLHILASDKQQLSSSPDSESQPVLSQRSSDPHQSVAAAPSARKSNAAMHTHYKLAQEVLADEDAMRQQHASSFEAESKQEGDAQHAPEPSKSKQRQSTMAQQYGVGRDSAARSKRAAHPSSKAVRTSKQQPADTAADVGQQGDEEEAKHRDPEDEEQQELDELEAEAPMPLMRDAAVPHRPSAAAAVPELSSWAALEAALSAPNVSPAEVLSLQRLLSSLRASTHASRGSILDPAATAGGKRIHPHLYSSPFALPARRLIENRTGVNAAARGRSKSPRKHDLSASSHPDLSERVLSEKQLAREQAWAQEELEWEQSMIASGRAQELFEMQQARHLEQQRRTRTKLPSATNGGGRHKSPPQRSNAPVSTGVQVPASPPKPQVRRCMLPLLAPNQLPLRGLKLHPFVSKDVAASVACLQRDEEPLPSEAKGKGVPRTHQALMARSQTVFSTHAPTLALVPLLQLAPLVNSASSQALSDRRPVPPANASAGGSQSTRSSRARARGEVQLASSLSKPAMSARDWSALDRIQLRAYSPPARSGIPSRAGAVALASSFREMEAQPPPSRLQSEIYSFLATPGGPTDAEPGVAPLERMPTSLPRVESDQIARRDAALIAQLSTHMTRALDAPPRLALSARDAFDPAIAAAHVSSSLDIASSARREPMGTRLRFEPSPGGNLSTPATEPDYLHLLVQERVAREALARGEIGEASAAAAAALAAKKEAAAKAAAEAQQAAEEAEVVQDADTRPATAQSRPLSATVVAASLEAHPQPQQQSQQRSDPPTPVQSRTPVRSPASAAASSESAALEPSELDINAAEPAAAAAPIVAAVATSVRPSSSQRPASRPSSQRSRVIVAPSSLSGSPRSSSPSGSPKSPPRAPGSAGKSSRARAAAALAAGGNNEGRRRGSSGHARRGSAGSVAPAATATAGPKSSAAPARSPAVSTGLRPRSAADTAAAAVASSSAAGSGSTPRSPRSPALGARSPLHAPRSPSSHPLAAGGSASSVSGSSSTADIALSAAVESILAASFASPYAGANTPEAAASSSSGAPSHSRRMSALKGSRPSSRERLSVSFNLRAE